ncbi:hypothetical protein [Paenibacillus sedimenti]|nr:hypothetical protein [Paenibacillus sedimenti]
MDVLQMLLRVWGFDVADILLNVFEASVAYIMYTIVRRKFVTRFIVEGIKTGHFPQYIADAGNSLLLKEAGNTMTHQDSSWQSQNPVSSAQNSVDNVHNAVSHAMTHPTPQTIQEAQNAITQAERAIAQAKAHHDQPAVQQAQDSLNQEKSRLQSIQ